MSDSLLTRLRPLDIVAFKTAQSNDGSMSLNAAITALQGTRSYACPQCLDNSGNNIGVIPLPNIPTLSIPCPTCQGYLKTDVPYVGKCGSFLLLAIGGNLAVAVSATTQLTGTVSGGTWASRSPSVATVDSNGLVTGVSAGTAVIAYTVNTVVAIATVTVS